MKSVFRFVIVHNLSFFDCLRIYSKEKRLTVFFDNAGECNEKDEFYLELTRVLADNTVYDVLIVFLGRL